MPGPPLEIQLVLEGCSGMLPGPARMHRSRRPADLEASAVAL
jgi:hypothetical protein